VADGACIEPAAARKKHEGSGNRFRLAAVEPEGKLPTNPVKNVGPVTLKDSPPFFTVYVDNFSIFKRRIIQQIKQAQFAHEKNTNADKNITPTAKIC
jgi:hypothetical protein